jgi:hypothetical protein
MREVTATLSGEVLARLEELVETTSAEDLSTALAHAVFHYSEIRRALDTEEKLLAVLDRRTGSARHLVMPALYKRKLRLLPPP